MDMKDTVNFIHLQEQALNLLIRVSALENTLKKAGLLDVESYNKELLETTELVADKVKEVYKQIDKLNDLNNKQ